MNRVFRNVLVWFIKKCFKTENHIVYIEGGLGSQMLAIMQHTILKEIIPEAKLDATYFKVSKTPGDVVVWEWQLDEYGISLPIQSSNLLERFRYVSRPSTISASSLNLEVWKRISNTEFNEVFPLHESVGKFLQELNLNLSADYAAIHIRRGDYLTVSSKLIQLEEFGKIIQTMWEHFQKRVLVFSDDPFTVSDRELITNSCPGEVTFISGMSQHTVHGAMRCASVLLTSNSTFSLTAALLSEHPSPIILAPTHFFSDKEREINLLIQQLSRWMLVVRPKSDF